MAKKTLLEYVQQLLTETDGDDVNSINDTVESDQYARIIRDTHDFIVDLHDLEHTKTVKQLTATSASTPNVMERPEGFYDIEWVRYDVRDDAGDPQDFELVDYMEVNDFIDYCMARSTDLSNVTAITLSSGAVLPIITDERPQYYTIMDEGSDELVFDSYDSGVDTNLQASKSLAYGTQKPSLTLSDSATMSVPKHIEQLILTEARAMVFDIYKDGSTREVDRKRRRMEVRAQRQRNIVKNSDNDNRPDYGRK